MYIIEATVMENDGNDKLHVETVGKLETAKSVAVATTEEGFFYEEDDDTMTFYPADMVSCVHIRKTRDVEDVR